MACACALFLCRVAAWTAGAAVPTHMSEVEGSVRPTLACSSNRSAPVAWMTVAVSYSKDDVGERPFQGRILERMRDGLQALCTAESPTHFSANAALKRRSSTVYSAQWLKPAALARLLLQGLKPCSTQRRCETLIHFL